MPIGSLDHRSKICSRQRSVKMNSEIAAIDPRDCTECPYLREAKRELRAKVRWAGAPQSRSPA